MGTHIHERVRDRKEGGGMHDARAKGHLWLQGRSLQDEERAGAHCLVSVPPRRQVSEVVSEMLLLWVRFLTLVLQVAAFSSE